MAFADPQSITVDSTPVELPRVKPEANASLYKSADENYSLRISHQESKGRTRRMVRIDARTVAADPLTAVNQFQSLGVYVVVDEPEFGFADDAVEDVVVALTTWLGVAGNVAKLLSHQH